VWGRDQRIYVKTLDPLGRAGFWSIPSAGGTPRLILMVDDPTRPSTRFDFAIGRGRLYFPISDRQGDVYVAELTRNP
jgi:hypothetical protein